MFSEAIQKTMTEAMEQHMMNSDSGNTDDDADAEGAEPLLRDLGEEEEDEDGEDTPATGAAGRRSRRAPPRRSR